MPGDTEERGEEIEQQDDQDTPGEQAMNTENGTRLIKATVLPMTKKRAYDVLNGRIFVIVRVRYIKVYIFKKRRS